MSFDKYADALREIEGLAKVNPGELKIDLQRIATVGKRVGEELLAGIITPEQAAGNFEDLTRAARARLQAQALTVAAAAQGIKWFDVALTALRVVKVVL